VVSYFGRLVEQSHLAVVNAAGDAGTSSARTASAGDAVAMATEPLTDAESVDLVEINEVVDAAVAETPRLVQPASPEHALRAPANDAKMVVVPPTAHTETASRGDAPAAIERVEIRDVSPSAEATTRRDGAPNAEGTTYEIAMRRVLEWVAAGPRARADQPRTDDATRGVEEIVVHEATAPSRSAPHLGATEAKEREPEVTRVREIPSRAIPLVPAVGVASRESAPSPRPSNIGERVIAAAAPGGIEDRVDVSIGSISVRIEAPPAPAPPPTSSPPRAAPPPPVVTRAPERGTSRLARRYLHP
jgi:hypothetical protein